MNYYRAVRALRPYSGPKREALADLLSDLRLYAKTESLDFDEAVNGPKERTWDDLSEGEQQEQDRMAHDAERLDNIQREQ
jgi:hypothetical protein